MRNTTARRVALTGVLFALALVLSWLESLLTAFLPLPAGVKLGLANIVVMYALFFLSRRESLLLVALKAGFALLTRGAVAASLSLAGGLCSLLVMVLLLLPRRKPSVLLVSVFGSLFHNIGQLVVVRLYFASGGVWFYAPVLLVSGIAMGLLTALSLRVLLPAMQKAGLARRDFWDSGKS